MGGGGDPRASPPPASLLLPLGLLQVTASQVGRLQRDLLGFENRSAIFLSLPTPRQLKKKKKNQMKVGEKLPETVTEGPLVS